MLTLIRLPFKKARWRGFSLQLFLIIILPLTLLLLVVAFGSQTLHHEAMRSLVGDRDLRAVQEAAGSLGSELAHRSATLQLAARSLDGRADFSGLILRPDEIPAVFDAGLALFSQDGAFLLASGEATGSPPIDWPSLLTRQPGYLPAILAGGGQPVFSPPILIGQDNQALVLVGALSAHQQVLLGAFTPSLVIHGVVSSLLSAGETTVLVVSPGQSSAAVDTLYRAGPFKADESSSAHPGIMESLHGQSGIDYFESGQGEHVVAYSPIASTGWGLVVEEAWEDIASPYLLHPLRLLLVHQKHRQTTPEVTVYTNSKGGPGLLIAH